MLRIKVVKYGFVLNISESGGGGGARTFSMAHMMKSTLGGGWCKTQISKSTQGSFFVFRWGCGVSNGDFEKYQGTFLRKMTIISLEINGKYIYLCIIWPNRLQLLL